MGVHHVAFATPDMARTHAFYTEAMGFELVKVLVGGTPEGGWSKHVFYDTGDGSLIAFWELHGDYPEIDGALSRAVGLPDWVNHLAFRANDEAHLEAAKKRWQDLGLDVFEVDHGPFRSIYTNDTNGTLVEWCLDIVPLSDADRLDAQRLIADPEPPVDHQALSAEFFEGDRTKRPAWVS